MSSNRWLAFATLLFTILALIDCRPVSGQSETVRWGLKKGQSLQINVEQKMKQVIKGLPTGDQEMPMNITMDLTWKVTDSDDEKFTVEQVIERIQMQIDSPMMNIDFDSNNKESDNSDPMAAMMTNGLKEIVGAKITQTMSRRGEVLETKLPEEIESNSSSPAGSALRNMSSQVALMFPEDGLEKGKSWNSTIEMEMPEMKTKATNTYTYEGTESVGGRNMHKFHISTVTEMEGGPQGAEINIEDQNNEGTIYFDAQEGRLHSVKARQKMVMGLSVSGMSMTQEIEGDTNVTVTTSKSKK